MTNIHKNLTHFLKYLFILLLCLNILSCSKKTPDMCIESQPDIIDNKFDSKATLMNKELEIMDARSIESKKVLILRYKKLAEANNAEAKYLLFFTYDLYSQLMDCGIVEQCFTSKSDIDYKEKCNKKIVDLRDYWIKEATDQHHPKALMSMAHLQSENNNDINLAIGNFKDLDPEIMKLIIRAANEGNPEAEGIIDFINKSTQ